MSGVLGAVTRTPSRRREATGIFGVSVVEDTVAVARQSSPAGATRGTWIRSRLRAVRTTQARVASAVAFRPQRPGPDDVDAVAGIVRVALIMVAALSLSLVAQVIFVSGVQHRSAQQGVFDEFRKELAEGTAPLGQTDQSGRLLRVGAAVALIEIPSIGVHEVVLEGTSSAVLLSGPGHRRNTPLPGQLGTSVIFGRQASYGGPFGQIHTLRVGATIVVTTGQGKSTFKVIDVRKAGALTPPALAAGRGRLQLVTATGTPYVPSGVLRVDADQVTPILAAPPTVLAAGSLAPSEQAMASDTSTLWALVLWLQALVVAAAGAVWSWERWGHQQTWIVFFPLIALIAFFANGQFLRLLPNLL